jgi:hypothetical protein
MFHLSALVILPLYFLTNIKLKNYHIIGIIVFIIIVIFFVSFLDQLAFILQNLGLNYSYYLKQAFVEKSTIAKLSFFITLTTTLIFIFFLNRANRFENFLFNASLYFLLLNALFFESAAAGRIGFYFKLIYILTIILLYEKVSHKFTLKSAKLILFSIFILNFIYLSTSVYIRGINDEAYAHYSVNFSLRGESYPWEISKYEK